MGLQQESKMYTKAVPSSSVLFNPGPSCDHQAVLFWLP